MRVNGRRLTVGPDSITYRGTTYPLPAQATYTERRRGIVFRRTIRDVAITGHGWAITGRTSGSARRLADRVNLASARSLS